VDLAADQRKVKQALQTATVVVVALPSVIHL
jgi:hypothetical protein